MCGRLIRTERNLGSDVAKKASKMIKDRGFSLVGQMMIGLPKADVESEIMTAEVICSQGADAARVYPTVVFYDTELCLMAERGEYTPLSEDEAVTRCARVLDVFDRHGVPCIRVGLCASENLSSDDKVYGGANHAAIGELAMGELYFERICKELDSYKKCELEGKILTVCVALGCVSRAVGQNKKNKVRLCQKYGFKHIKVLEKKDILGYNIDITF